MEHGRTNTPAQAGRVRVLCVDDNEDVIDALRLFLSREPRLEWAGWLPDAGELLSEAHACRPDIVLLDVDMPRRDPFEALRALAAVCPDVRVIMLSGHVRNELVNRAIAAGAWGYVAKGDGQRAILDVIAQVANGEFAMSSEVRTCYAL
jgi:two-component system, NarL family, response regulator DesR